jgi:TP53 regulating kinase-like protein
MRGRFADYTISEILLEKIGVEIAKLHLIDIIHGDLTTSNMLLRASNNDLVRHDGCDTTTISSNTFFRY